jgi:hypothetical protein
MLGETLRHKPLFLALAAALICAHPALAQPVGIDKRHAYERPKRPAAQLATIYGKTLTMPLASPLSFTMIREVDGKSVRGMFEAACCSVVYVLPGTHRILVHYQIPNWYRSETLTGNFAAGRVYEAVATQNGDKVAFHLRDAGTVLTYKDVMPTPYLSGTRQNSRVDP